MAENLQYISANSDVPFGRVSSTARKGDKWHDLVEPGDVVNLQVTGGEVFGQAVIIAKELVQYHDVIENADHNHVAFKGSKHEDPAVKLESALTACYGHNYPDDEFTILHIMPLGRGAWEFPNVEEHLAAESRTEEPEDIFDGETYHSLKALKVLIEAAIDVPGVAAVESTAYIGELAITNRVEFESAQDTIDVALV